MDIAVDTNGRATVAWLTGGVVSVARQGAAGGEFTVERVSRACDFGRQSIRAAVDTVLNAIVPT